MLELFKALADNTRLRILAQMSKGEMCVCEIEECLKLTQSNTSRHLTILKKAGILESCKTAQWAYYRISESFIQQHRPLYDYLLREINNLPYYAKDCKSYEDCKLHDLCRCKRTSAPRYVQSDDKEILDNE